MLDIFHEVLGGNEQAGFFVWRSNFHEAGEGETEASLQEGMDRVRNVVRASTFSCIMQKWGGKREVMYTAFKALGDSVDYIQVRAPPQVCVCGCVQPARRTLLGDFFVLCAFLLVLKVAKRHDGSQQQSWGQKDLEGDPGPAIT